MQNQDRVCDLGRITVVDITQYPEVPGRPALSNKFVAYYKTDFTVNHSVVSEIEAQAERIEGHLTTSTQLDIDIELGRISSDGANIKMVFNSSITDYVGAVKCAGLALAAMTDALTGLEPEDLERCEYNTREELVKSLKYQSSARSVIGSNNLD